MNTTFKQSALKLAVVSTLALGGVTSALAQPVGGSGQSISTLRQTYVGNVGGNVGAGQTDTTIVSGTIDNNNSAGWKLTVTSGNLGKLKRAGGGGAGREILYTNIKLVKMGGTLGAGLTDPAGTKNIVTGASGGGVAGTTIFNTGSMVGATGRATTPTVNYAYALKISWAADSRLLSGNYTDNITVTLAND